MVRCNAQRSKRWTFLCLVFANRVTYLFLNEQWQTTIKKKPFYVYYLLLVDYTKPMLSTCQKEANYHRFLCDSWYPKGVRHVWGRSAKCLGLIPFRHSPQPFPLLHIFRTRSQFQSLCKSFWKWLLCRLTKNQLLHVTGDKKMQNNREHWEKRTRNTMKTTVLGGSVVLGPVLCLLHQAEITVYSPNVQLLYKINARDVYLQSMKFTLK